MRKIIIYLNVICLCCAFLTTNVSAYSTVSVFLDGKSVESDVANFMNNGRTYVSVKALFEEGYTISWDARTVTATVYNAENTFLFSEHANLFFYNQSPVYIDAPICIKDGRLFVPLRAVSESLGYRLNWNAITKTAMLYSDNCDIQPEIPETEYTETDLYWLSRIICAESCVEPYEGKIAVGNVVLNRVKNPDYPDTIYDVIFDRKYAVQFEPTANGTIYQTPDETCIRAAKECLSGRQVINDCLYFLNPELAKSKWIIENCKYITTIGGHDFYV